jgi:GTP-binding protein
MRLPVVAIVGRPNVGKSTLFNRLLGKRDAIVDDVAGVTRDRNYGESEWNGKKFRLIDTGGYVPQSEDLFEVAIREQVEIAINESDSILFLVDFKSGLNPIDKSIINLLRQSKKEFFVVVNKVDNELQKNFISEFFELGVTEIYDISALNGRRLGDLLDKLTANFSYIHTEKKDNRLKIAIVGRPNVGKSSLANALLGEERSIVTEIPGTTRDSIDSILKYYGEEIILIDTAGLRKKSKVQESIEFFSSIRSYRAIGECDVAIVVIDAVQGFEHQDQNIIDEVIRWRKGLIIAVNKWDLIEKDHNTAVRYKKAIKSKLGSIDYAQIIFISALTKQRIFKLIELSKNVQSERLKRISTSELNEFLLPEIEKNPPPATKTGKEIKIKYVTMGGQHYPLFIFFANYPKQIPDNYKRFLENVIRRKYGYAGVPLTLVFKSKFKEVE